MTGRVAPIVAGEKLISVEGVAKSYRTAAGPVDALASISMECARGEFVSLLGPSGCGKSTLLMIIAGLEEASGGRVLVAGEPVRRPRTDVGIVFQDPTLLPWRTTLENVLFPIELLRLNKSKFRDRAAALLDEVGLGQFLDKKPHELSGGMRQRVAICRALIHEPDILLMDEPFSALDAITRDQMNELLLDLLARHSKTVLFVTHSIREAVMLSDRVLVMGGRPGRIVGTEPVKFPRPRSIELEDDPSFVQQVRRLRGAIETSYAGRIPQAAE